MVHFLVSNFESLYDWRKTHATGNVIGVSNRPTKKKEEKKIKTETFWRTRQFRSVDASTVQSCIKYTSTLQYRTSTPTASPNRPVPELTRK